MTSKKSIRFFNDRKVRAVWSDTENKWYFSATDVVRAINDEEDYTKAGNYWRWMKKKLSGEGIQLVSATHDFKFEAPDGKMRTQTTFDEIVSKYVEMNVAHPFMEGNGRSTRIWLDLIFKRSMQRCVDWSRIDKKEYLKAMRLSTVNASEIHRLLRTALTDRINDREMFMKGIDYSYYYEQED